MIGGYYRGRRLRAAGGLQVRPTSDRLRETLFNILSSEVEGSRFLDICAGSGAVAIEALSRGASHATLIEASRRACSVIEENLRSLGISERATLINRDAVGALRRLASERQQFDIAFFDPPYDSELYSKVMTILATESVLSPGGILVVEHRAKAPPAIEVEGLRLYRRLKQGESALAFYERV
ncbi:MAG TPA: 16S rRNA (guanine(966)-N(2))-methyltransferase RsmD [Blastocatellia bacterium]|nr:16S rRNA (guanine(966)-N(2))-methyltransferase RsmD [Blastocatellia bacterium]